MQGVGFINNLKVRAGYGLTGNQEGLAPYMTLAKMGPMTRWSPPDWQGRPGQGYWGTPASGQWGMVYAPTDNPNPALRWEVKKEFNFGLDFGLFENNWLTGAIDVYDRTIEDLISNFTAQKPAHIHDMIQANAGTMRNHGVELMLDAQLARRDNFSWNATFVGAQNFNKIIAVSNDQFQGTAHDITEITWLVPNEPALAASENFMQAGQRLFNQNCSSCHGQDKRGKDDNPSLLDVHNKYDSETFINFLNTGRRMMPAFQHLAVEEKEALAAYLLDLKEEQEVRFQKTTTELDEFRNISYRVSGFEKFKSKEGYPAIAPPWGTLTAIDLNTGEHLWRSVLGEDPEMQKLGVPETGTENFGGPLVTNGGLLFIAATKDEKFRAFNKRTGELIWETNLPASGFATPSTYEINGRQFVIIACGGGKLGAKSGDALQELLYQEIYLRKKYLLVIKISIKFH